MKTILGIDIGQDNLKIAQVRVGAYSETRVINTASVQIPVGLIKDGRAVSTQTLGETIRNTVKESGMKGAGASFALSGSTVVIRNISVPQMSVEQLLYNLPFEFKDYISGELKDYLYDYAIINNAKPSKNSFEEELLNMELTGVAVHKDVMTEVREVAHKAGIRLLSVIPAVCAYQNIVRSFPADVQTETREYCFVDFGYNAIRIYMFKDDICMATRELDIGMNAFDAIIADDFNVDPRLAHTYFLNNYEGCQSSDNCVSAYNNIITELTRALNYYKFTNRDSALNDIWLCGGGAQIKALNDAVTAALDMNAHKAQSLIVGGESINNCESFVQAIGCALLRGGDGK